MTLPLIKASNLYSTEGLTTKELEIREIAINDFRTFIRLVAPFEIMGHCHEDWAVWMQENHNENFLLLQPRDCGKSRKLALYALFELVREPDITIIYASWTEELPARALGLIQDIMCGKPFQKYFPGLINAARNDRDKWQAKAFNVDHPLRQLRGVLDYSFICVSAKTSITGRHGRRIYLDDMVNDVNSIKQKDKGREQLAEWFARLSSIQTADGLYRAVGTRYHVADQYAKMQKMILPLVDEKGNQIGEKPLWRVKEDPVEKDGQFLWPRTLAHDGLFYGFDAQVLANKKTQYAATGNLADFYAQYYNNPNNEELSPIKSDNFRYYDKSRLIWDESIYCWLLQSEDQTHYEQLNLVCACDLAATDKSYSDYSVMAVAGMDRHGNIYVIDIVRMKTALQSEIEAAMRQLYSKWKFKRLRIEAVGSFRMIGEGIKMNLEKAGIRIPITLYNPLNVEKSQRINSVLEPLYAANLVFHYRGGNCEILEKELLALEPEHDDTKDAWSMAVTPDLLKPPIIHTRRHSNSQRKYNSRFGGLL